MFWTTDRELHPSVTSGTDYANHGQTLDRVVGLTLHKRPGKPRPGMTGPALPSLAAHLQALGGSAAHYEVEVAGRWRMSNPCEAKAARFQAVLGSRST